MEPMGHSLPQPQLDAIAAACRRHQVRRMHLFGSALRDDFDPSRSDLADALQVMNRPLAASETNRSTPARSAISAKLSSWRMESVERAAATL